MSQQQTAYQYILLQQNSNDYCIYQTHNLLICTSLSYQKIAKCFSYYRWKGWESGWNSFFPHSLSVIQWVPVAATKLCRCHLVGWQVGRVIYWSHIYTLHMYMLDMFTEPHQ